ncbi:helix-turn-helix domain-containing protein [Virgibacillus necropolis]|uniref:MerR family transcriptional regulator n=1 Tax=Virgibacillus necropolis TaxID=163877 RepID=UPI00384AAF8E
MELISITSLCHSVGVPQNTVENWIEDYNCYIPETDQYYHLEAINVLNFIKRCKAKNYHKSQIMKMLAHKNFSNAVEIPTEDIQSSPDPENYDENILAVMQTIGKTVEKVTDQDESIEILQEDQTKQKQRIKATEKQISALKLEIQSLKQEPPLEKEYEMKKKSFAKLFQS